MAACWNAALDADAVLEISKPAFDEIRAKLEAAGYQSQFVKTADGIEIDMHGIAVKAENALRGIEVKP